MAQFPHKVLIADSSIRPQGVQMVQAVAEVTFLPPHAPERDLLEGAREVDAILARSAKLSRTVIEGTRRLKIISRHGVGVDSVDVAACTERGILVTITGDANSEAVSEYAFGLLLATARKIAAAHADLASGQWRRENFPGVELFGKTLGIIGLGRIGSRFAKHAQGFDMTVLAYDPYADAERARSLQVSLVDLKELLGRADFITIHTPLTAETTRLIGQAEFDQMKPSAILVNAARGALIDEAALYRALKSKRIAGAGLDAFAKEPLATDHPLRELENVVMTPHIAGQTEEAMVRMSTGAAENILRVLRGEMPDNIVNPEVLKTLSKPLKKV